MRNLVFFLVGLMIIPACSKKGGGSAEAPSFKEESIRGHWEQVAIVGPDGQRGQSDKAFFDEIKSKEEASLMHMEINEEIINFYYLASDGQGNIRVTLTNAKYEFKDNKIMTQDSENTTFADYQVISLSETEMILRPSAEDNSGGVAYVVKRIDKKRLDANISEAGEVEDFRFVDEKGEETGSDEEVVVDENTGLPIGVVPADDLIDEGPRMILPSPGPGNLEMSLFVDDTNNKIVINMGVDGKYLVDDKMLESIQWTIVDPDSGQDPTKVAWLPFNIVSPTHLVGPYPMTFEITDAGAIQMLKNDMKKLYFVFRVNDISPVTVDTIATHAIDLGNLCETHPGFFTNITSAKIGCDNL